MKVAVSGVNGFVGVHLASELAANGHQVVGLGRGTVASEVARFLHSYIDQDLRLKWPDLSDGGISGLVHLAGLSAVGPSYSQPQRYIVDNSSPMTLLGEQAIARGHTVRIIVVSTGAVYVPGINISESGATTASSPYAVSKLLVENQCDYYRARGADIAVMRPFNHIGPRQQQGFLLPDLLAGIRDGKLMVGDLDTRRDYTDVRDVVRAYRLALEAPRLPPTINVCSGTPVSGRDLLDLSVKSLGLRTPLVALDRARLRPNDAREISGDFSLAERVLGWRPTIPLHQTIADTAAAMR